MKCNVGGTDKVVRIFVGLIAGGLGIAAVIGSWHVAWSVGAFVVAGIALGTAIVGFCPLNKMIGLNTCGQSRLSSTKENRSGQ